MQQVLAKPLRYDTGLPLRFPSRWGRGLVAGSATKKPAEQGLQTSHRAFLNPYEAAKSVAGLEKVCKNIKLLKTSKSKSQNIKYQNILVIPC